MMGGAIGFSGAPGLLLLPPVPAGTWSVHIGLSLFPVGLAYHVVIINTLII